MSGKGPSKRPKKISDYGKQLLEKQAVRNTYGLREKQFRKYFNAATKVKGQTGLKLLETLETRLDNVVFRAGFAMSRAQARQMVSHRHFMVNGHRVDVPSIIVKEGDVIESYNHKKLELNPNATKTDWLKVDTKKFSVTIVRKPASEELPIEFDTQKIVEFYSR